MRAFHFVMGAKSFRISTYWWDFEERVRHAGHEVRGAGPQRRQADAGAAGKAAVDVGHERRGPFVSGQDEADRTVAERVHQLEVLLPRDPEGETDAFTFQAGDK